MSTLMRTKWIRLNLDVHLQAYCHVWGNDSWLTLSGRTQDKLWIRSSESMIVGTSGYGIYVSTVLRGFSYFTQIIHHNLYYIIEQITSYFTIFSILCSHIMIQHLTFTSYFTVLPRHDVLNIASYFTVHHHDTLPGVYMLFHGARTTF